MRPTDPTQPLKSSRQEKFARLIAAGGDVKASYIAAGYARSRSAARNASRLKYNLRLRIADLRMRHAADEEQAKRKALKKSALTMEFIFSGLKQNVEMTVKEREIFLRGRPTGRFGYNTAAANRALETAGRALGMFSKSHDPAGSEERRRTGKEPAAADQEISDQIRRKKYGYRIARLRRQVVNDNYRVGVAKNSEVTPGQDGGSDMTADRGCAQGRWYRIWLPLADRK